MWSFVGGHRRWVDKILELLTPKKSSVDMCTQTYCQVSIINFHSNAVFYWLRLFISSVQSERHMYIFFSLLSFNLVLWVYTWNWKFLEIVSSIYLTCKYLSIQFTENLVIIVDSNISIDCMSLKTIHVD